MGSQPTAPVDDTSIRVAALHDEMAEVAEHQQVADLALADALSAVRRLEEVVAQLRDPERVDDAQDTSEGVDAAFTGVDPARLRQPFIDLALAVDDARATLRSTREVLDEDWQRGYLDAEDQVLTAVRAYAETADKLVQVVVRHWPTFESAHAVAARFVEQRWFYRSAQEAADAFEVQIGDLLPRLNSAQREIAKFVAQRQDAARAVNEASETASRHWRRRPGGDPTPTP
ncbi:MAG: hypothetical protein KY469_03350 [Actinobacteria bacterium]|nr:hypothetical protein [Actinomycetota bacterium]